MHSYIYISVNVHMNIHLHIHIHFISSKSSSTAHKRLAELSISSKAASGTWKPMLQQSVVAPNAQSRLSDSLGTTSGCKSCLLISSTLNRWRWSCGLRPNRMLPNSLMLCLSQYRSYANCSILPRLNVQARIDSNAGQLEALVGSENPGDPDVEPENTRLSWILTMRIL